MCVYVWYSRGGAGRGCRSDRGLGVRRRVSRGDTPHCQHRVPAEHLLTAATTDSEDGSWEEKGQRNQESSEGAGSERGLGKDEPIPRANLIFQTVISGLQEAAM